MVRADGCRSAGPSFSSGVCPSLVFRFSLCGSYVLGTHVNVREPRHTHIHTRQARTHTPRRANTKCIAPRHAPRFTTHTIARAHTTCICVSSVSAIIFLSLSFLNGSAPAHPHHTPDATHNTPAIPPHTHTHAHAHTRCVLPCLSVILFFLFLPLPCYAPSPSAHIYITCHPPTAISPPSPPHPRPITNHGIGPC